jgi:predicted nucleotidyltransferase
MKSLPSKIADHILEVRELCQRFGVLNLSLFGSVLTEQFGAESDLDFLVEFDEPTDPVAFGLLLINFEAALSGLFNRRVDVVVSRYVQNPFFKKKIDETKRVIYDRRSQKMPV